MRQDSRLSRVLHVLLHLERMRKPATSELIAGMLGTDPAVVRRVMAGLRAAGIVASAKGHQGGWTLVKPLSDISLMDIYKALGSPTLFAIGNDQDEPACVLARAANKATMQALEAARHQFEVHLASTSVADLASDWPRETFACGSSQD